MASSENDPGFSSIPGGDNQRQIATAGYETRHERNHHYATKDGVLSPVNGTIIDFNATTNDSNGMRKNRRSMEDT